MHSLTVEEVPIRDLLEFADAYASLETVQRDHIRDLIAGDFRLIDAESVRLIEERLQGKNAALDAALAEYRKSLPEMTEEQMEMGIPPKITRQSVAFDRRLIKEGVDWVPPASDM